METALPVSDIAAGDFWSSFLIPVILMVSEFCQYHLGNKGLVCKLIINHITREIVGNWIVNS